MAKYLVGAYRYNDGEAGIAAVREDAGNESRTGHDAYDLLPPVMLEIVRVDARTAHDARRAYLASRGLL